jgi:hypothetical protein
MADNGQISREASRPEREPSGGSAQFGLTAAMALIVGSIIGVGRFNLPTSLARTGSPRGPAPPPSRSAGSVTLAGIVGLSVALDYGWKH